MVNRAPAPATGIPTYNSGTNSAGETAGNDQASQQWPATTWQGWQVAATTPPPAPPQPGDPPRTTEQRLAYHSAFVTLRTPAIDTLATQVHTLTVLGRHQQHTARPSLIVTDPRPPREPPHSSTSDAPATSPTPARPPHRPMPSTAIDPASQPPALQQHISVPNRRDAFSKRPTHPPPAGITRH